MKLIEHIDTLPQLPETIGKIQQLCTSPDVDVGKLYALIDKDPMLKANILKLVNAPLYGLSSEITSIQKAIMLFGVSMIRGIATSLAVRKTLPVDLGVYGITLEQLSELSALQVAFAKEWLKNAAPKLAPQLLGTVYLMELGRLLIAKSCDTQSLSETFEKEADKNIAEMDLFGMDRYSAAGMMFKHWNFEENFYKPLLGMGMLEEHQLLTTLEQVRYLEVISVSIDTSGMISGKSMDLGLAMVRKHKLDSEIYMDAVGTILSRC